MPKRKSSRGKRKSSAGKRKSSKARKVSRGTKALRGKRTDTSKWGQRKWTTFAQVIHKWKRGQLHTRKRMKSGKVRKVRVKSIAQARAIAFSMARSGKKFPHVKLSKKTVAKIRARLSVKRRKSKAKASGKRFKRKSPKRRKTKKRMTKKKSR